MSRRLFSFRLSYQYLIPVGLFFFVVSVWSFFLGRAFIFDDVFNLTPLENSQSTLDGLMDYIASGVSGPTKRPVALFSFWLQKEWWPSNPVPFKFVNVVIHAFNVLLVYGLVLQLLKVNTFRLSLSSVSQSTIPFLASIIWAFHPGNVSSVLYVVQRMNLLAVFWGLLGLNLALSLLRYYNRKVRWYGPLAVLSLFLLCVLLAAFSKENGVLFLFLLPACYFLLWEKVYWHKYIVWLVFVLGAIMVFGVLNSLDVILSGYEYRGFTFLERMLTETKIWLIYVGWFFYPSYDQFVFFHDDVRIVSSVWEWGFLLPLCAWVGIYFCVKKHRLALFAFVWFIISHSLEGTLIPLELMFEHRNYLATIGFSMLVGWGLYQIISISRNIGMATCLAVVLFTGGNFFAVANIWADYNKQLIIWSELKPDSVRVKLLLAAEIGNKGQVEKAYSIYRDIHLNQPSSLGGQMSIIELRCVWHDTPFSWDEFKQRALVAEFEPGITNIFDSVLRWKEQGECDQVGLVELWAMVQVLRENPKMQPALTNFGRMEARLCFLAKDYQCYIDKYEGVYLKTGLRFDRSALLSIYSAIYGREKAELYIRTIDKKVRGAAD